MCASGVIQNYALFGAVAWMRYTEPVATLDADMLVAVPQPERLDVSLPLIFAQLINKYGMLFVFLLASGLIPPTDAKSKGNNHEYHPRDRSIEAWKDEKAEAWGPPQFQDSNVPSFHASPLLPRLRAGWRSRARHQRRPAWRNRALQRRFHEHPGLLRARAWLLWRGL